MRILVTGGAGFIGSNFIHLRLSTHPQDKIVNLDKLTYAGNLENLEDVAGGPNYQFIKGDICDPQIVKKALSGVDVVVHFAAESHVDRSIMDPATFIKTNVLGTEVLLSLARQANVKRFHHISTDEVFGALELDSPQKFTEGTPYQPRSPYAASKAAADHLVRSYYTTYNLPVTITNCADNFGPYQYPEKLISLAITNLLEGKKIPVYGDGHHVRDWLFVQDHVAAINLVLQNGAVGETYLVGTNEKEMPNIEVVKKIIKAVGVSQDMFEYVKDRPGHDRRYAVDATKIKKELGWKPKYDFDSALALTVAWYKKHRNLWRKLKDKKFEDYYKKQYVER